MDSAIGEKGEAMSIILKGIDLPNCSNEDCIVVIRKDKAEVWQTGFKERTVEAIQIPKDHGRLIDGDELVKHLRKDPLFDLVERYGISGVIESRPTILEAEE